MNINETLTLKLADLARLKLTPEETQTFTDQLGKIIGYIERLNEVELTQENGTQVAPLMQPFEWPTALRPDAICDFPPQENGEPRVLKSAPETLYQGFKVPSIL
jgi:aspartyl-tRNA(Asn)/glutamyl-tRNA(Gln) amidotransferase subunit C